MHCTAKNSAFRQSMFSFLSVLVTWYTQELVFDCITIVSDEQEIEENEGGLIIVPWLFTVCTDGSVCVVHVSECQLEQLRERIQQSIKTLPRPRPYTWKSVQGCADIGPDMLWYRGQVLEVLGGHVKVRANLHLNVWNILGWLHQPFESFPVIME